MKSNGQLLYEHKHPSHIKVVPVDRRHFATEADVLLMPTDNTPWRFLTAKCQQSWEFTAQGHNLFSKENS